MYRTFTSPTADPASSSPLGPNAQKPTTRPASSATVTPRGGSSGPSSRAAQNRARSATSRPARNAESTMWGNPRRQPCTCTAAIASASPGRAGRTTTAEESTSAG